MKWVKDSGICDEKSVCEKISSMFSNDYIVLAFFSDCFRSCKGARLKELLKDTANLLEVRAFDAGRELWLYRSSLGAPFAWRLADENECEQGADFFVTWQMLDIDTSAAAYKNNEQNGYGCLKIRSTVKGEYALPIQQADRFVKIINYVRYDGNGIAGVADYRIVGFEKEAK